MNAKWQKAAVLMSKSTVKIQNLLKDFPPKFENPTKQAYNEKALYYHRYQNGLIKISQWKYDSERKSPLKFEKLPLTIETSNENYTYESEESSPENENSCSFWVNFSNPRLFSNCDGDYFSQGDTMALAHPLLLSCVSYLKSIYGEDFIPATKESEEPTPFVFQNVPFWVKVTGETLSDDFEVLVREKKSNIISMCPPSGRGEYAEEQIEYLLKTVLCAFGGGAKSASALKKTNLILHTGNWGCGSYGNNEELIYFVQIFGAMATGFSKIIFHKPNEEALSKAKKDFEDFSSYDYYGELFYQQLVKYILDKKFTWAREDIKTELAKNGLWLGMTDEDRDLWRKRQRLIAKVKNIPLEKFIDGGYFVANPFGNLKTVGDLLENEIPDEKKSPAIKRILEKLDSEWLRPGMTELDWQNWAISQL